jgi:hypothetical protein
MDNALNYIVNKFNIDVNADSHLPIKIPETTREELAVLYSELGFKTGAEIGVERGAFSERICINNPQLKLYCIDAWEVYNTNDGYTSQEELDRYFSQASERLSQYNCKFIKKYSQNAVEDFPENSLDFVYLDANHNFDYVMNDIILWSPKVKNGGIVSGHDYVANNVSHTFHYGVIEATNAYTKAHNITPWFVFDGERSASWFWVKP